MKDNEESNKKIVSAARGLTALAIDFMLQKETGGMPIAAALNGLADFMSAFAIRKVLAFKFQLASVTPEQYQLFQSKEFRTQEELTAFWEKEMLDLARFDDDQKATIKGRLLKAVIEQNIRVSEYRRMCLALDQMLMIDFDALYESFVVKHNKQKLFGSMRPSNKRLPIEQCAQLGLIEQEKIVPIAIQQVSTSSFDKVDAIDELYKELKWNLTTVGKNLIQFGLMIN